MKNSLRNTVDFHFQKRLLMISIIVCFLLFVGNIVPFTYIFYYLYNFGDIMSVKAQYMPGIKNKNGLLAEISTPERESVMKVRRYRKIKALLKYYCEENEKIE